MQNASTTSADHKGKVLRKTRSGAMERDSRFIPLSPDQVETIPPWDREECRYHEVPAILKRMYNFSVRVETIYRWMKDGRPAKDGSGTVHLASNKKIGRIFVKKADLIAFMDLT